MNNETILDTLTLTTKLLELHDENPFKIKSMNNVIFKLNKTTQDLSTLALADLEKLEGIGKSIAQKINEINTTGKLQELENIISITPPGVIDMLSIKGIGPKKVALLWKELGVETIGELLYACYENRLITLKGFGEKTQTAIKINIEFKLSNTGKVHYAAVEKYANELVTELQKKYNTLNISLTGAIRRKNEVIEKVEVLCAINETISIEPNALNIPVEIIYCTNENFSKILFETTATAAHLEKINATEIPALATEAVIYQSLQLQYIEPELREGLQEIDLAKENKIPTLINDTDLKGILHNHSTYSDGKNTLREMAIACKEMGYEYLGISDHSQTAVYAGGLKPDAILKQHQEIDALNKELAPFRIFKGIESDILNDGKLDYSDDILKSFDFIVASIHQNFKMTMEKATERLIKAIENPYTTILGHPTGRLLLHREGYPVDHKKIIDACAANKVVIELNAHPYRLDIDWRWINYCMEKGVLISINPDAHDTAGYLNMHYGVCAARKGMLTKDSCFNAFTLAEMEAYL